MKFNINNQKNFFSVTTQTVCVQWTMLLLLYTTLQLLYNCTLYKSTSLYCKLYKYIPPYEYVFPLFNKTFEKFLDKIK